MKVNVLHITYGVDSGGVEAAIYNYYAAIDRSSFHFDVLSQMDKGQDVSNDLFANKFKTLGSEVYYIPSKSWNLKECIRQSHKILKGKKYDIVHIHMGHGSLVYVAIAKLCGIKNVVVHSHIAFDAAGWSEKKTTRIMAMLLKFYKTYKAACSKEAAEQAWPGEKVYIMNNAIDVQAYIPNENTRSRVRKSLNLDDSTAICAVARFVESKQHSLLIDIFTEYLTMDKKAKLVLIGNGELEEKIKDKVNQRNLQDKVLFLGSRSDVPQLLQGMDAFVLPSEFEGFGMVYVEAQLAGLPTFAVEGAVPQLVKQSDSFFTVGKNSNPKIWADIISCDIAHKADTEKTIANIKENGLDIGTEAKKLEKFYSDIMQEKGHLSFVDWRRYRPGSKNNGGQS